jgi:hypothetical protein
MIKLISDGEHPFIRKNWLVDDKIILNPLFFFEFLLIQFAS